MPAQILNIVKGRFVHHATLPLANDAIVWVLFSGTETDANILDTDTLTTLIALAVDEATFTGYSRQTATGTVVTVDDTNNRADVTSANPSWSPTSAQALTRIAACYDDDTTVGTDANILPLFVDDFALTTPTSGTTGYTVNAAGWGRAA